MYCSHCGRSNQEGLNFCRTCGSDIAPGLAKERLMDPDELTGRGIRDVIIGDGVLMVAIILGVTTSAVSGFLWLSLLIPAFYFFGKGFSNVLYARQIRKRMEREGLIGSRIVGELLPPSQESVVEFVRKSISGELLSVPSVIEKTTRRLEKGRRP